MSSWWDWIYHDDDDDDEQAKKGVLESLPSWTLCLRCMRYARPYWRTMTFLLVIIILHRLVDMLSPLLFMEMIDTVLPSMDINKLNSTGIKIVGAVFLSGGLDIMQDRLRAQLSTGLANDLQYDLFTHFQKMSLRFYTKTRQSEITSRIDTDVNNAQQFISETLVAVISNFFLLVVTLAIMLHLEWRLTLLALLLVPLFYYPSVRVGRQFRDLVKQSSKVNSEIKAIVNESLNVDGILLAKLYGQQARTFERYNTFMKQSYDLDVRRSTFASIFYFILTLATSLATSGIQWLGGLLVLTGSFTPGTIVAFSSFVCHLHDPIMNLSNVHAAVCQSFVCFERIFEVLDLEPEIMEAPNAIELTDLKGCVEIRGVSFCYNELEKRKKVHIGTVKRVWDDPPARGEDVTQNTTEKLNEKTNDDVLEL
jgi:ATP-binding cassette subfamily B protein